MHINVYIFYDENSFFSNKDFTLLLNSLNFKPKDFRLRHNTPSLKKNPIKQKDYRIDEYINMSSFSSSMSFFNVKYNIKMIHNDKQINILQGRIINFFNFDEYDYSIIANFYSNNNKFLSLRYFNAIDQFSSIYKKAEMLHFQYLCNLSPCYKLIINRRVFDILENRSIYDTLKEYEYDNDSQNRYLQLAESIDDVSSYSKIASLIPIYRKSKKFHLQKKYSDSLINSGIRDSYLKWLTESEVSCYGLGSVSDDFLNYYWLDEEGNVSMKKNASYLLLNFPNGHKVLSSSEGVEYLSLPR